MMKAKSVMLIEMMHRILLKVYINAIWLINLPYSNNLTRRQKTGVNENLQKQQNFNLCLQSLQFKVLQLDDIMVVVSQVVYYFILKESVDCGYFLFQLQYLSHIQILVEIHEIKYF
ncbi:Hypothetical_protein [Hexamita inflata]|uniref:Hypothetical_protein n=1 Tax=Hexamita inflata TaxID=28002 RepID=A0AA86QUU9_9EUKA|nr:Hypothetical protein HINF_LOCUS52228 [Hexamita inflata]